LLKAASSELFLKLFGQHG